MFLLARGALFVLLATILTAAQPVDSEQISAHEPAQPTKTSRPPVRFDVSPVGHRDVARGMNLYSRKDEQLLGNKLAALVERNSDIITDPLVTEYVNRVAKEVSLNSDSSFSVNIKVVRDVEANAYSLPGGFIYLGGGLILATENEAQLVAVLSHEIAHISGRHLTNLITQQKVWKWSSLFAGGPVGYLFEKKAGPFFLARSLRRAELEADLLGLQYVYASGYDPREFVNLIRNLCGDEEKLSFTEKLSALHPPAEVRIRKAQHYIRNYLPVRETEIIDTSEFQDVKVRVRTLMDVSK